MHSLYTIILCAITCMLKRRWCKASNTILHNTVNCRALRDFGSTPELIYRFRAALGKLQSDIHFYNSNQVIR